jgi:hypothetical protein
MFEYTQEWEVDMGSNLKTINKKNLEEAYQQLLTVVSSDSFLANQGLNNEVPFHICPCVVSEPPVPESVSVRQVRVSYHKPWLSSEGDVDEYLDEYKKALLEAIAEGKRIQL